MMSGVQRGNMQLKSGVKVSRWHQTGANHRSGGSNHVGGSGISLFQGQDSSAAIGVPELSVLSNLQGGGVARRQAVPLRRCCVTLLQLSQRRH